ncbi:uncharacterized protein ATNIH1004_010806 [Aspergillus tanneri]|uniref:Uncharacterized protein n=1 Tax=Aspergillus tanneri TaxID=1220188 RepID=A0A5M9MFY4_9EURO|nr:uncharacterized protein ATNIH1004_010806 [Aspergillus tanneri]KAA8641867.1 hypothetical protein ATNIH1004_010806 [Aspergillus tanneri]
MRLPMRFKIDPSVLDGRCMRRFQLALIQSDLREQLTGYSSLWSVKFSFLFLLRKLVDRNCITGHSIWLGCLALKIAMSLDIGTDAAVIVNSGNVLRRTKINWF